MGLTPRVRYSEEDLRSLYVADLKADIAFEESRGGQTHHLNHCKREIQRVEGGGFDPLLTNDTFNIRYRPPGLHILVGFDLDGKFTPGPGLEPIGSKLTLQILGDAKTGEFEGLEPCLTRYLKALLDVRPRLEFSEGGERERMVSWAKTVPAGAKIVWGY